MQPIRDVGLACACGVAVTFALVKLLIPIAFSLRLDADLLDWFKGQSKGCQTRINAIPRVYMQAMKSR